MTKEEIIEMARQAGFLDYELDDGTTDACDKRYEAFARLVAEHEREMCAKVCDDELKKWGIFDSDIGDVSKAIRARGNHD